MAETRESQPRAATTAEEEDSPYYREYTLLIEYKHLAQVKHLGGIYVVPSPDSIFVWHGVIFIRQGMYRQAIFKFIITMPPNYPNARPSVKFVTRVYHPLISVDGEVDLSIPFPNWIPHQNWVHQVLLYIKKIFYQVDISRGVLNQEAAEQYSREDKTEFLERVASCVRESIQNVFVNIDNSSLQFSEWCPEFEQAKQAILNKDDPTRANKDQKGEGGLLSLLSKAVTKIITIKY